ncbi:MAG: precorrin-4 C(11)-methyltransferase, partial [Deltaproteobacteria bacterium]
MKKQNRCKVYFIGAGPGDPELITVKGQRLIREADLVLYAGSLVPKEVVACAKKGARVMDSSSMTLDQTHTLIMETVQAGGNVARVHTGDPSLYGALREQVFLLDRDGVEYEVVPGVSVAFAAAARAGISFTLPEITQTLILTRIEGKTPVPARERLKALANHGCSLAIYLSAWDTRTMVEELVSGGYPEDTLVFTGYRIGWPDEAGFFSTLSDLTGEVEKRGIKQQAVFLILPGQERSSFSR